MIKTLEFETIDSTNSAAKRYLESGGEETICFVAHTQTHGRGQGERVWHSQSSDGLYYSLLLHKNCFPASFQNAILGQTIQNVIHTISGVQAHFKDPNDIYLDNKKLGGILIENQHTLGATYSDYAIIGIGLNINQKSFPPHLQDTAISLFQKTGKTYDKYQFVGLLNLYLEIMFPVQT